MRKSMKENAYDCRISRFYGSLECNKFGNANSRRVTAEMHPFLYSIKPDPDAYTFFSRRLLPDGRPLPADKVQEYCDAAAVLNALSNYITELQRKRRSIGLSTPRVWTSVAALVSMASGRWRHNLPENEHRLLNKLKKYKDWGYLALMSN